MSTISTDVTIVAQSEKALPTIAGTTLTNTGMYIGDKPLYKGGNEIFSNELKLIKTKDRGIIVTIRGIKTLIVLNDVENINEYARNVLSQHLAATMKIKAMNNQPIAKISDLIAHGVLKGLTLPKTPLEAPKTMDFPRMSRLYVTEENIKSTASQLRELFTITTQIEAPTE